jgi:hypothetical protein
MRKGTVSSKASTITRRIAKVRIHVERAIRKLKCFSILRGVIPLTMKPYVTSIAKVCAALVNLQPSIIEHNDDDDDDIEYILKSYYGNILYRFSIYISICK